MPTFQATVTVLGALLIVGALLSGLARRSFLSLAALLVLDRHVASGARLFDVTALVVFCSIVLHSASDTAGANWIARRAARAQA